VRRAGRCGCGVWDIGGLSHSHHRRGDRHIGDIDDVGTGLQCAEMGRGRLSRLCRLQDVVCIAPAKGEPNSPDENTHRHQNADHFFQGLLTNVLNPKVALFFLAFLPQFIRSDASSKAAAFIVLGLVFASTGTVWNLIVAWSAGRLATTWSGLGSLRLWLERSLGVLFVGLGVRLALSDSR
jgi:hypothetical protein